MAALTGCGGGKPKPSAGPVAPAVSLRAATISDSVHIAPQADPISISAARNEWTPFIVQIDALPAGAALSMRLRPAGDSAATLSQVAAYQVLPVPIDTNRAEFVRHTGLDAAEGSLPRALLPLKEAGGSGKPWTVDLSSVRQPTDGPVLVWIDLQLAATAPAGESQWTCEIVAAADPEKAIASLPLQLRVYDFSLPRERHLHMVAQIHWPSLVRHYPADFESVTPRLLNRGDRRYAGTIKTLDSLVKLAQHHRLGVIVPKLQPTVKWPANINNAPPDVDWQEFDSVVTPWFRGEGFADGEGLDYWPLPEPDFLKTLDLRSRVAYWSAAASHFEQMDWLDRTSVPIERIVPGRANLGDAMEMSVEASHILAAHPRVRVSVPLEDDQLQFASHINPRFIQPETTSRLLTSSPGLVFATPAQSLPADAKEPGHWLRTDLPGLVPYGGAGGNERDVRLWAWLAFLRKAQFVMYSQALPSFDRNRDPKDDPTSPADPSELIWFYPGHWFGVEEPVPTIQLKWLRQAQQDFEYLWLAWERGEKIQAWQMARVMTKPVEVARGRPADPSYTLMCGTSDAKVWAGARDLLVRTILLSDPANTADEKAKNDLYIQTLQWARPQERPLLMGRGTEWAWAANPDHGNNRVELKLALDIYNASETTPNQSPLRWTALPPGWEVKPQPVIVPQLNTFQVYRAELTGRFDVDKITPLARRPLDLEFTIDAPTAKLVTPMKLVVPVARSARREGRFNFDGRIDDWTEPDLIQDGPMVKMLDRPDVQKQAFERATVPSKVYSGWSNEAMYVAFDLAGVTAGTGRGGQNFVDYQARRTWGEDLCELLVQPVYSNNQVGPILHIVCKPNGSEWVERKLDPRLNANPWEPLEGAGIRYATQLEGPRWTGEVAIPWRLLSDPRHGAATFLRFNFAQHRTATGESASWAGPVDFGRDDAFTGVLHLHLPQQPAVHGAALTPAERERYSDR